jgi:hypothetical protein
MSHGQNRLQEFYFSLAAKPKPAKGSEQRMTLSVAGWDYNESKFSNGLTPKDCREVMASALRRGLCHPAKESEEPSAVPAGKNYSPIKRKGKIGKTHYHFERIGLDIIRIVAGPACSTFNCRNQITGCTLHPEDQLRLDAEILKLCGE